jgi:transposase
LYTLLRILQLCLVHFLHFNVQTKESGYMMNERLTSQEALLFQAALGIQSPWTITNITLNKETHELHIYLNFEKVSQFPCPICNSICSCYDTQEKIWQHLSFFEYTTFLHARTPRISCKEDGVHRIQVPWARSGSGFTLLMEIFLLLLCKETTVKGVERITKVPDLSRQNSYPEICLSI